MAVDQRKHVVVVGLGMVGIAFIEKLLKLDARTRAYDVVVIGEEPHVAYNRVGLTSFFEHRKVEDLYLNPLTWYEGIQDGALKYHLNTKVSQINTAEKTVSCISGDVVPYDILVLATGSDALLPRHTPGHDANGVFVYRNIDDLERLIEFAETRKDTIGAVVGGGLLGLEAAKAMLDLERYMQVKVIERNRWVLSRQLDEDAGGMVVQSVRELGVDVMLGKRVGKIDTDDANNVVGVRFEDGEYMECSTICFAIGVRPRDELARKSGIKCADRGGGIVVADDLSTSESGIYAIGECASWQGQTFGLIAPGVEMADVLAFNLTQAELHSPRTYKRPDLSTKLKLLGVEVASFGDFFADRDGPKYLPAKVKRDQKRQQEGRQSPNSEVKTLTNGLPPAPVKALTYKDPFSNVYKKYLFTMDGKYLLGGMMIGDTRDYVKLVPMVKTQKELDIPPSQLILGASKGDGDDGDDLPDDTQICSCHNVTKGDVASAVKDGSCTSIGDIKSCTKAGTGCGGCMPLVTSIFNKAMKDMGNEVKNHLCPHFEHSRAELYHIVMVKRLRNLAEVMREAGTDKTSVGCEACKPAVAGILASLWNSHVMAPTSHGLQDTNDKFLGNIQRDGSFSVVPRVSGGEIAPDRLIVMGQVAQDYGLYTKITGGQRIDMFGAKKQDLPAIWKRLIDGGMESGHAYAKSLRTVKSCVGSTWCRYGLGDSVGLAVRLEERYKGLRAPHKIKGGVSGCVRECAEAQSKDFGLIATEKGFNVYVAGNGGATPRHAEILALDVPPTEVVTLLDRYLMFYIRTADKLQRTARWVENLPGGIEYLRKVVVEDSLGINASLEAQMQELVDSYYDEWAEGLADPGIKSQFRKFVDAPPTPPTTPPACEGEETVCHDGDEKVFDISEAERVLASPTAKTLADADAEAEIDYEIERGQRRPAMWARTPATEDFAGLKSRWSSTAWQPVAEASHFAGADALPNGISARIRRGDTQLALFRVRGRYYATQQMCPHKRAFVLSDGLVGEDVAGGEGAKAPWVSCPHHKRNFDLSGGSCKNDSELSIATFECEEREDGLVYVRLPPVEELDAALGTKKWKVKKGEAGESQLAELDRKIGFVGQRAKKPGVKPKVGVPFAKRAKPVELMVETGGCGSVPEW